MKLQTVWTKIVVVIYLVAVVGVCLYVPTYGHGPQVWGEMSPEPAYKWVWNLGSSYIGGSYGYTGSVVDYGRVVLEVVSLTAIAGVLFIVGSFVEGRKRGKQSDPSTL